MLGLFQSAGERRKTPRQTLPRLKVKLGGRTYKTEDWSLGGLRIEGYPGRVERLQRLSGKIAVPGGPKGPFTAEVMWQQETRVGLRFIDLPSDVFFELTARGGPRA
jgi:hypothetical protein